MSAAPKNVEYYVSRINGYSKNTIRLQPVSVKTPFISGDVLIFRLPTNAIIDLHTLAISWDLQLSCTTGGNAVLPRYSQSFVRRIDVTAGGVQVGLGSLNDYGGLWSLLATNGISPDKTGELSILDGAGGVASNTIVTTVYSTGGTAGSLTAPANKWSLFPLSDTLLSATYPTFQRQNITGFLGVLGGQYMRFLDTNLLPDVEIRVTLASNNVIAVSATSTAAVGPSFGVLNPKLQCETISFGDSTYEQMVEARLSTGEPIVVPFINHASFETSSSGGTSVSAQTQFTVATQSLNTVMGTARVGNYDSAATAVVPASAIQTPYYDFTGGAASDLIALTQTYASVAPAAADSTLDVKAPGRYQITIDSKVYPQFLADVGDCYQLTKNAFDGSGNNKAFAGLVRDLYPWSRAGFMLAVSLDHNSEESMKDRLISGLNTNGSNIPITWQMLGVNTTAGGQSAAGIRPTVFAEMTSTLMLYPGRVISVIN